MIDMVEMSDKNTAQGKDRKLREIETCDMITPLNQMDISEVVNGFDYIYFVFCGSSA